MPEHGEKRAEATLESVISRRDLLAFSIAGAGCRRKRGAGFGGYAFVANEEGEAIAAVDLTAFAVIRHIPLGGKPTAIVAHPTEPLVYALTPSTGTVHEVSSERGLGVRRRLRIASSAISMRLSPSADALLVLCEEPKQLVRIPLDRFAVGQKVALPAVPFDFDISPDGSSAAVSLGADRSFLLADLHSRQTARIPYRGEAGLVRFQSDGRAVMLANTSERMLSVYDFASRRPIAHLPLAVRPDHFCFKPDGGQLFITGDGMDAVVIVYPYHTPQVAETVLAGRAPAAMAASEGNPGYLFVTNPPSGDITIFNITTRRVIAVASVGADPAFVTITPDNQYALVLNRRSGDMAVLLIGPNLVNRQKSAALFTLIPVGSGPVSAVVRKA